MRLKIVLHIKIQFVSSDFRIFNETHFTNLEWSQQALFRHLAAILYYCTNKVKLKHYPEVDPVTVGVLALQLTCKHTALYVKC